MRALIFVLWTAAWMAWVAFIAPILADMASTAPVLFAALVLTALVLGYLAFKARSRRASSTR